MFILIIFLLLTALTAPAEDNHPDATLNLPDVILRAEDTTCLIPPPPARHKIHSISGRIFDRMEYSEPEAVAETIISSSVSDSVSVDMHYPSVHYKQAGRQIPETPKPSKVLNADVTYIPGRSLTSTLETTRQNEKWIWSAGFDLGLADGWLNPNPESATHFIFDLFAQTESKYVNLDINTKTGLIHIPEQSSIYFLKMQKGLSAHIQGFDIEDQTSIQAQNRDIYKSGGENSLEANMEARLGEEFKITGPGEDFRIYFSLKSFIWGGNAESRIQASGTLGMGGIWLPFTLPFTISGGGSLIYYDESLNIYPEGFFNLYITPSLIFKAKSAVFLSIPEHYELLTIYSQAENYLLGLMKPQGGFMLQSGLTVDTFKGFNASAQFEYLDGTFYRIQNDRTVCVFDEQGRLLAYLSWMPFSGINIDINYSIGFPFSNTLSGALEIGFHNIPLAFIIKALWGDSPCLSLQDYTFERWKLFSGLMLSLETIWTVNDNNTWSFGIELLKPDLQDLNFRFLISYGRLN